MISAAVGTVYPGMCLSHITNVQCLSFELSDPGSLVPGTSVSQVKFPCAISRQRLNLTLIANSIVDFVSRCFRFQMEPDFARETVLGSIANPGSRRGGGYPG